jgi:hypothetical protein
MGQLFCSVAIKVGEEWVEKSDSGIVTADTEKVDLEMTQKGSASDAFKRACVKWGIGRFLYDLDMVWLDEEAYKANRWNLTEFINKRKSSKNDTASTAMISEKKDEKEMDWLEYPQLHEILKMIEEGKFDDKNGQEVVRMARMKSKVSREDAAKIDSAMSVRVRTK